MTANNGAEVFNVEVALEHALYKIAQRRKYRDDQRHEQPLTGTVPRTALHANEQNCGECSDCSANETFHRFRWADPFARSGVRPVADPTNNAITSFATTPAATMNKVSVPTLNPETPRPEFE